MRGNARSLALPSWTVSFSPIGSHVAKPQDLKPYGLSSVPDVKQVMLEAKHKASSSVVNSAQLRSTKSHDNSIAVTSLYSSLGLDTSCTEQAKTA